MDNTTLSFRRTIGILGIILPWFLLLNDLILGYGPYGSSIAASISAHHFSPAYLFFEGLMVAVGIFLLTYQGYDIKDKVITKIAGIGALGLAFFPTDLPSDPTYVSNWLSMPQNISAIFHNVTAITFFAMMATMILWQFTKTNKIPSKKKLLRNKIYIGCGVTIIAGLVVGFILGTFVPQTNGLFWGELIALQAFGFGWLVKGKSIKALESQELS